MEHIEKKLEDITYWAAEKKAEGITVLDVGKKSSFTDYFVLCNALGEIHTRAIADNILEKAKQNKYHLLGKEGMENGKWILLDYGDVVVHIFDEPVRSHYKLEELWEKLPNRENQQTVETVTEEEA